MQALTKLAFQVDKFYGSDTFAPLYGRYQFNPSTLNTQDDSLLMSVPTELRLIIYAYLFPPHSTGTANQLAILTTCRQCHGEAIELVLRRMQFHINPDIGLAFQSKLRSLGPLQNQLRRIKVRLPASSLTCKKATNPFTLIELPLDKLDIELELPKFHSWFVAVRNYHWIVSAILYKDAHASAIRATKRRGDTLLLKDWATQRQLCDMLVSVRAKQVVVMCKSLGDDVFWSAFAHFRLVDSVILMLRCGKEADWPGETKPCRYMLFATDGEQDLLEFGQCEPSKQEMV